VIEISIIGTGNVASYLAHAFAESKGILLRQIVGRTQETLLPFNKIAECITSYDNLHTVDILIIAVSDNVIHEISQAIPVTLSIVTHTSGSTSIDALKKHSKRAIFYPLQSFSKNRNIDFSTVPICLEAANKSDLLLLEEVASALSDSIHFLNSESRAHLHQAAVFANNFCNHILYQTEEICKTHSLDFNLLKPLMTETVNKAFDIGALAAQTGPAKRQDTSTIKKQLENLKTEEQKLIYKTITQTILKTYGKEKL
tara:strand:- start:108 stop:875 length:768 start_codon:yes stop_codon:yes gene_type:complete